MRKQWHIILLLSLFSWAAGPCLAEDSTDIFADDSPYSQEQLREKRGGFSVAGFEIEFALDLSLAEGNHGVVLSDPIAFQRAVTSLDLLDQLGYVQDDIYTADTSQLSNLIVNTMDGVVVGQDTTLNLVIPNFHSNLSRNGVAPVQTRLLSTPRLNGFGG